MRCWRCSGRRARASARPSICRRPCDSGRDPDVSLKAGIGLDAGEAVPVGDGFRGRALNMAARLCARAEPGEILITPELAHLVGVVTGVAFQDKGPVHLKGFSRPGAHARRGADQRRTSERCCRRARDPNAGRVRGQPGGAAGRDCETACPADPRPPGAGCEPGRLDRLADRAAVERPIRRRARAAPSPLRQGAAIGARLRANRRRRFGVRAAGGNR